MIKFLFDFCSNNIEKEEENKPISIDWSKYNYETVIKGFFDGVYDLLTENFLFYLFLLAFFISGMFIGAKFYEIQCNAYILDLSNDNPLTLDGGFISDTELLFDDSMEDNVIQLPHTTVEPNTIYYRLINYFRGKRQAEDLIRG